MKVSAFTKTYNGKTVITMPDFTFKPNTIYALIGSNGCGKSTFSKVVSGIIRPDQKSSPVTQKMSIGYLSQNTYAFRMSTLHNVMLNEKRSKKNTDKAINLLKQFGISDLTTVNASRLSGGETARMGMARIIMRDYDVLILDEPTASMDVHSTILTEQIICEYQKRTKCTVLLITHSLRQAERIANDILFFHEGLLKEYGSVNQILNHPQYFETKQFIEFYSL